jgi:hypothetical protein
VCSVPPRLPPDDLEVQHRDRVEHRHQDQGDHRRDRQPTNLRVAERLPQRSAVQGERHPPGRRGRRHGLPAQGHAAREAVQDHPCHRTGRFGAFAGGGVQAHRPRARTGRALPQRPGAAGRRSRLFLDRALGTLFACPHSCPNRASDGEPASFTGQPEGEKGARSFGRGARALRSSLLSRSRRVSRGLKPASEFSQRPPAFTVSRSGPVRHVC